MTWSDGSGKTFWTYRHLRYEVRINCIKKEKTTTFQAKGTLDTKSWGKRHLECVRNWKAARVAKRQDLLSESLRGESAQDKVGEPDS